MALDSTTEEIRRRADIVEVVGQYVALRPAGNGRWKACCPFHDEKTPSFNVSQDKGFYKCFGCGVAGDVFKFVMGMENVSFAEARQMLAERYGVPLPERRELTPQQKEELSEKSGCGRSWRPRRLFSASSSPATAACRRGITRASGGFRGIRWRNSASVTRRMPGTPCGTI
jgi:DNA primase